MDAFRKLIDLGKEAFENKNYDDAEKHLRKVADERPHYADVMNILGVICHMSGRFTAATSYFQKALKINPNYTEALLNLTVLYNDLGKYEEAKKLYTHLKKKSGKKNDIEPVLKGKLSNLHAEIGDIYRSLSLYPFAICEYEKALELNPGYLDIRTKLGQALRENGDLARSKTELEQVVKANTHFGPGKVQLGVTLYCVDKVGEARKLWKQVIDKNPENEYAKMYLKLSEFQSQKTNTKSKKTVEKPSKSKKKSSAKKAAKKKSVKKKATKKK